MENTITGNIEYEPQVNEFSTKGLYRVKLIDSYGARRAMWVDKTNGSIFLSTDGVVLRDGEEVYEELFGSTRNDNELLFEGIKVREYLGSPRSVVYDNFGPAKYGTDIDSSTYEHYRYIGYDGISFLYGNNPYIKRICGKPEMFTYNGVTLDKSRNELIEIFGIPAIKNSISDNPNGISTYSIEYKQDNYTIKFEFESEDGDANIIEIY